MLKYCILLMLRYTYCKNAYGFSYSADIIDLAPIKMTFWKQVMNKISHYSMEYKLNYLYHDFDSTFYIAY